MSRRRLMLIAAALLLSGGLALWLARTVPAKVPIIRTAAPAELRYRPDRNGRAKAGRHGRLAVPAQVISKTVTAPPATPKLESVSPKVLSASGQTMSGNRLRAVDSSGALLGEFTGRVTLKYVDSAYYAVGRDDQAAKSTTPIKLIAPDGSAITAEGYTDLNWNKSVNLNQFRGSLELVRSAKTGKLWVVNELTVEDYVAGIGEASADAPVEHLKVMSDIARSYAWWHLSRGGRHAGEPFHLKNSRNGNGDDQIYQGYLAEVRLPRYSQAARQTAGEVVFFQGRPVITPYSTRASGRTLSPAEAGWNVDWPWVVSVPDPDTANMSRLGHGVGLSGYGSRKRAERGDSHEAILSYYFQGTSLGHVDSGNTKIRIAIYSL